MVLSPDRLEKRGVPKGENKTQMEDVDLFKTWVEKGPLEDKDQAVEALDNLPQLLTAAGIDQEEVDKTIAPLRHDYSFGPVDKKVKAQEAICDILVICKLGEVYTDLLRITHMATREQAKERMHQIVSGGIREEGGKNPKHKKNNESKSREKIIVGLSNSIKGLFITNNHTSRPASR